MVNIQTNQIFQILVKRFESIAKKNVEINKKNVS